MMTDRHHTGKSAVAMVLTFAMGDETPKDLMWVARTTDNSERLHALNQLGMGYRYSMFESFVNRDQTFEEAATDYCNQNFWLRKDDAPLLTGDFRHVGGFETDYQVVKIFHLRPLLSPQRLSIRRLRTTAFIPVDEVSNLPRNLVSENCREALLKHLGESNLREFKPDFRQVDGSLRRNAPPKSIFRVLTRGLFHL